jgi:putative membrane protein
MTFLRYLSWLLRAFLFLVLLLFALKNTSPVKLQFFFDTGWEMPLIVLLLGFFALGMVLGVMGCLVRVVQQRREINALRRQLEAVPANAGPPPVSSAPPPSLPPELGL